MTVKTIGRFPSFPTTSTNVLKPRARRKPLTGLTVGSSMKSQSSTLEAPASAPGM